MTTAEGLAVDWIGNHIYWVESGLDIIEVADLDGNNRSTIISSSEMHPMHNPRSIAVDPRVGFVIFIFIFMFIGIFHELQLNADF